MNRKALAAIIGLAILSVTVLLGSVMTALASFDEQEVVYSAVDIPEGLLNPEPIDAVRHKPPTPDLVADIVGSPLPGFSPQIADRPTENPSAKESPRTVTESPVAPKVPRFEISIVSSAKGRSGNRTLSYEITIKNIGEVSLAGLVVRSHVPSGTSWAPSPACGRNAHEVLVTYPDTEERLCVAGPQIISGDSTAHPAEATLNTVDPGMSVKVRYVVDVEGGQTGTIVNHAHLSGSGVDLQSASTSDDPSATQ